jgi:glutamate synthase (NADPH/NADH) small chain
MSKRFLGDNEGHVAGLQTVQVEWTRSGSTNGNGHRAGPRETPGTEKNWPAQLILLALGFLGPETEGLLSQLGVELDERGNVAIDEESMSSVPRIFAAGDMTRGQSLVVWAIADGRRAARGIDRYLMGETTLP